MLKKGINFFLICTILIIIGCSNTEVEFNKKHEYYKKNCNCPKNNQLVKIAVDTIVSWTEAKLLYSSFDSSSLNKSWVIDSFVYFNSTSNRAIMNIITRDLDKGSNSDIVTYLLSEKLKNNQWYFFYGATMYVPRKNYNSNTPLSFKKLSEIGRKEMLNGYYYKPWPWSNSYEINEQIFKNEFEIAWTEKQKWEFITRKKRKKESNS